MDWRHHSAWRSKLYAGMVTAFCFRNQIKNKFEISMKNILYYTLIGMVLFSCSSCRSKKSTTTTSVSSYTAAPPQTTSSSTPPSSTPTQPSTTIIVTQPQNAPQIQNDNVRLVVSFFSIGQGIDLKTHDEFLKFLDSYPKKIAYSQ